VCVWYYRLRGTARTGSNPAAGMCSTFVSSPPRDGCGLVLHCPYVYEALPLRFEKQNRYVRIKSVACYMFRLPVVSMFREVFCEGCYTEHLLEHGHNWWPKHVAGYGLYKIILTYFLTPWCRVLLEKLTGLQLVKKFPAFYGTRRFITAFTSVRHLSLS